MCENVLLASALVSVFHKQRAITKGCLQVDLTKAYFNLEWTFLFNILEAFDILEAFELPLVFINLIKECISTPFYSVAPNRQLVGFFQGKKCWGKGIWYSITLCFDDGYRVQRPQFNNEKNLFWSYPQWFDLLITHLSFTDDILIFLMVRNSLVGAWGSWYFKAVSLCC